MAKKIISGINVSPGIRLGKAFIYKGLNIVIPKYNISENEIESEIKRFEDALAKTKDDIKAIQEQIADNLSSDMSDIFTSHLMMLEDPLIADKAFTSIREEKRNIEWILNDISMTLIKSIGTIEDEYFRERIIDISDIHKRLISNLQKVSQMSLNDLDEEVIVFATDLTPSDTALMNRNNVLAFVTDKGGKTSHTAILARAMEIPAVLGTINGTASIKNGDQVIVDGFRGKILVNPDEKEISDYIEHQQNLLVLESELAKLTKLPTVTTDDEKINVLGNIELPEETKPIKDHGANGIGLFRSEFLFIDKSLPGEERQLEQYKKVVNLFDPLPVTIRTIDVGGDKVYEFNDDYKERNPFLGCRAIRFSLANEPLFRTQIRAILRASHYGNVKIMFPMISTVEELLKVKELFEDIKEELRAEGKEFNENIPLGIMIEVPSAAINADILAKHVDFFSIGTNDLVQYTLAVDRIGEKVAYLYNPVDLSVLRLLKKVREVSSETDTQVSICGEMAGEPRYTMLLIGLGFRNFSMSSAYMYQIKRIIRSVSVEECVELADKVMSYEKTSEADAYLSDFMQKKFPFISQ